jgi:N-methylhydantoinase A
MTYQVGVDSGGTFTDLLVIDGDGNRTVHKTSSTPDDPARALVNGLTEVAERLGVDVAAFICDVDLIVHGTTVSTNALLTRRGASAGLLCTEGFRDTLPLRDGRREEPYNNRLPVPVPLVPRYLRLGIPGRFDYTGKELVPLDESAVRAAAQTLLDNEVEAVTICFVHSPANADHETRAAEIVRELMPDVTLTVSSDLLAQVGLFERTSTAVLNSYVSPIISRYMSSLTDSLAQVGFAGVLLLMQSNGGVAAPEVLSRRAALSLLSGPASGPAAGLSVVAPLGRRDCITVDMGGTSFDAAIVQGGEPLVMTDGWVDRWRLALPMLDIHTVGAGGGSVAFASAGMLRVGPFSAGADPGPACYGRGGTYATVTDADLVLGYLSDGGLLGGSMTLDSEASRRVIASEVAVPLGMDLLQAAAGIYEIVNVNMAEGVREVSVNRGWDPRDFPLVVAGGAGPVHAAAIAEEIGIPVLVVPRESSVFCAGGAMLADFKHDFVRSLKGLLGELPVEDFTSRWRSMRTEGLDTLAAEGIDAANREILPAVDVRYKGQWHELTMEMDPAAIDDPDLVDLAKRFHAKHDQLFGYATPDMPIEVMNTRVRAVGRTGRSTTMASVAGSGSTALPTGHRDAWSRQERAMVPFALYAGLDLGTGDHLCGPALIELPTTTIVVPESFTAVVDHQGSFVLYSAAAADEVEALLAGAAVSA